MSILVNEKTKTIVQGITGKNAALHTKFMIEYGTRIVAGVTPGKGGMEIEKVMVYDTVKECMDKYPDIAATSIWVPPRFACDAILEAVDAGIKTIVVITERIPIHDMLYARAWAKEKGITVIGGNTPGVISPGKALIGMLPTITFKPGRIGTVARSGAVTYYLANSLNLAGFGESTSVGLGGDPILGANFEDILREFENDPDTDAVVMAGEIGGVYEELAAPYIGKMKKPVIAYITGKAAPQGKRLGHAGAIVEGNMGTAKSKIEALRANGAIIAETFSEIPELVRKALTGN
ncbi:succinate--CoA ligase subunit alpha [candidate division WOR-3 bacterium RBG_13_43_14]|uniref:Succinate--CoA ligase [ADP-forming] subunit alpha n=1 Tax=candidate division WOR-3 bacterium RBG_13_43_14 TaxID=1802590 RepID=A0A1F4UAH6_UNCW3|nr:MAG: succinate--CoA ligase subunit alpha [candidate division WOR-3 bacterium RBG_13_43_14]